MKICILIYLVLVIQNSYATDYALILAGASRNDIGAIDNEFSRPALLSAMASKDKGVETTLLFSGKDLKGDGKKSTSAEKEQKNYKGDYDYVNKNFPDAKAATEQAFLEALTKLEKKMNAGDNFRLQIYAHGYLECQENPTVHSTGEMETKSSMDQTSTSDKDKNCHHEISVYDEKGQEIRISTNKIIPILKKIDAKGVKTDITLGSCHSGILKGEFDSFKNACVISGSSANGVAYACFEHDPPTALDFTSTTEVIDFYYNRNTYNRLKNDPFFNDKKCLQKIEDHISKFPEKISNNESIQSLFLKAHQGDKALSQSSISSLFNIDYFNLDFYNKAFMHGDKICDNRPIEALDNLTSMLKLGDNIELKLMRTTFNKAFKEYNELVDLQSKLKKDSMDKNLSEDDLNKIFEKITKIQKIDIKKAKANFISAERSLINFILKKEKEQRTMENPCDRKFN